MRDTASDFHEPDGSHEGHWPHEALRMLRLSPPTQAWVPLLREESVVDVLRGGTGRRTDRPSGTGGREGVAGDRGSEEQAK